MNSIIILTMINTSFCVIGLRFYYCNETLHTSLCISCCVQCAALNRRTCRPTLRTTRVWWWRGKDRGPSMTPALSATPSPTRDCRAETRRNSSISQTETRMWWALLDSSHDWYNCDEWSTEGICHSVL